jgi:hypothetical protein
LNFCKQLLAGVSAALVLVGSVFALPPNSNVNGFVSYEIGQGWVSHEFTEAEQNRYFAVVTWSGRSYCFEAVQGSDSPYRLNPTMTVYQSPDESVVAQSNDNDSSYEPAMLLGSRVCWIDTSGVARTQRMIKVSAAIAAGSGESGFIRFRVYDTSVVAPLDVLISGSTYRTGSIMLLNASATYAPVVVTTYFANGALNTDGCWSGGSPIGTPITTGVAAGQTTNLSFSANCYAGWDTAYTLLARVAVAAPSASVRVYARQFGYTNTQPVLATGASARTAQPAIAPPPPNAQLSTFPMN